MPENQRIEWKESWQSKHIKSLCAFANTEGGTMYIGVDDDGKAVGVTNTVKLMEDIPNVVRDKTGIMPDVKCEIKDGKEIITIEIKPYPFPVSYEGGYYIRSGSTTQKLTGVSLDEFLMRKRGITWDNMPIPNYLEEDISGEAVKAFADLAEKKGRVHADYGESEELLDKLHLYRDGYMTNAGALIFSSEPEKYNPGAYIKIGYFENNTELIYQDEIHGSILLQADKAIDLIYTKYLKAIVSYEGIQRIERYPVPVEAVREAILNAIVHKDYSSGIPIQIKVSSGSISIGNTGRLPANWGVNKLMQLHNSVPYNPLIANVFYLAGYIESWGRGVEKIFTSCREQGIGQPVYSISPADILIQFGFTANEAVFNVELTELDRNIISLMKINSKITTQEIAETTGKSRKTVSQHIQKLKAEGIVEREGSVRNGFWKVM